MDDTLRSIFRKPRFQFANAEPSRREVINDAAAVGEDGWAQLAPFGDFSGAVYEIANDGTAKEARPAIQRMDRDAAEAMVAKFRRPLARLKRWAVGLPIFHGHPDQPGVDLRRYPDRTSKGVIADLEVRADGLYGRPVFNNEGRALLESQPGLAFSARWEAELLQSDTGSMPVLRPSELLSAGLTRNPNLPVQAINDMPLNELIAALAKLGIVCPESADLPAVITAINQAADQRAGAAQQMCNERDAARTELETLRAQLVNERTALGTERDQARTDASTLRGQLINERASHATLGTANPLDRHRRARRARDGLPRPLARRGRQRRLAAARSAARVRARSRRRVRRRCCSRNHQT